MQLEWIPRCSSLAAAVEGKYQLLGFLKGIVGWVKNLCLLVLSVGVMAAGAGPGRGSLDISSDPTINCRWTGTSTGIAQDLDGVILVVVDCSLIDFVANLTWKNRWNNRKTLIWHLNYQSIICCNNKWSGGIGSIGGIFGCFGGNIIHGNIIYGNIIYGNIL